MFGPWLEAFVWLKGVVPDFSGGIKFKLPKIRFNYLMLHYIYILTLIIITSIIMFGGGNMPYVDALFFASGASTQSGLNTIDVNTLYLYQQVTIMLIACIANPIFINTFVVFVRLYWFERRFQHVVLEARRLRTSRTRSRTRTQMKEENPRDADMAERGVGGRKILVMRPGRDTIDSAEHGRTNKIVDGYEEEETTSGETSGLPSSDTTQERQEPKSSGNQRSQADTIREEQTHDEHLFGPPQRAITFADEVQPKSPRRQDSDLESRLPVRRSTDQHISFLENQRNPKGKKALYIPGPRAFDRGEQPAEIDEDEGAGLRRVHTGPEDSSRPPRTSRDHESGDESGDASGNHLRRKITNKLSLENAGQHLQKTKLNIVTRMRSGGHGGDAAADDDPDKIEKFPSAEEAHGPGDDHHTPTSLQKRGRATTFASFLTSRGEDPDPMPYLSYQATIGRNSAFVNLTEEQRDELGGIEYRALKTLALTLVSYYVGFHLFGMLCLLPWVVRSEYYSNEVIRPDGISPVWWGFFTPASLFNDLGFTLTPDSMVSFKYAVFPLLVGSYLIIIGNTAFPCMLRLIIWILSKVTPRGSSIWEEYRFLLDHPRRCFTLLFPSNATWWLFWVLFVLNVVDLIFFIILDLGDPTVTSLPPGIQVLSGWFQAASTRTAGFSVVNLADLHPAVQVSYLIMMYISIFPIAISIRNTNVYEEKSLGVWQPTTDASDTNVSSKSFVGNHLRRQLSFDLWYVFLGLFIIAIVEGERLQNTNEYAFTVFSVLFEVVSAYGTVGLSLGYPNSNTSFSGQFHTLSKLVIIAMQIRGRHRGLPYALDKAILLPSEEGQKKEAEDATMREKVRRASVGDGEAVATGVSPCAVGGDPNALGEVNSAISGISRADRTGTDMSARSAGGRSTGGRSAGEKSAANAPGTEEALPPLGFARTQTGRSSMSGASGGGGQRRKKGNNLVKLVGSAFTAGPARKHD